MSLLGITGTLQSLDLFVIEAIRPPPQRQQKARLLNV